MIYCRQFDQFDPLVSKVPYVPFVALREIAERARGLLHGATVKQIIELAETVEWIIDRTVVNAQEESQANDDSIPQRSKRSAAQWLRESIFFYDIASAKDARFPHHHHAFAVLALWLVADANFSIQPELDQLGHYSAVVPENATIDRQWMAAGKYAIDAMEAICLAEQLASRHAEDRLTRILFPNERSPEASTEAAIQERISVRARAAAIEKHKTNRAARLRVIELYTTRNYTSVEAAAQSIAPLVFKAPRTVARWIYEERKGRSPPTDGLLK